MANRLLKKESEPAVADSVVRSIIADLMDINPCYCIQYRSVYCTGRRGRLCLRGEGRLRLVGIHLPQLADTSEGGGHQESDLLRPGRRGGYAHRSVSEYWNQAKPNTGAGRHLQHTRQNGEGAVSHALDGEADDIQPGPRGKKKAVTDVT